MLLQLVLTRRGRCSSTRSRRRILNMVLDRATCCATPPTLQDDFAYEETLASVCSILTLSVMQPRVSAYGGNVAVVRPLQAEYSPRRMGIILAGDLYRRCRCRNATPRMAC